MMIRAYKKKDRAEMLSICMGDGGLDANFAKAIADVFCSYYLDSKQTRCFVLDDGEKVCGYILCHPDFETYKEDLLTYLKNKKSGPMSIAVANGTIEGLASNSREYPAHFHIQVASSSQCHGYGTSLLRTLEESLIDDNIKALMLNVAVNNDKAKAFYKKNGYVELSKNDCEIAMGKRLLSGRNKE